MNWYVERCYGFGAAGVPLAARPYSTANGATASWKTVLLEVAAIELSPSWRRNAAGMFVAVVALIALTIAAPHRDLTPVSGITIARFDTPQPVPEDLPKPPPIVVPPVVAPQVVEPEPIARPEPKPVAKPKPIPEPVVAKPIPAPALPSFPSAPAPTPVSTPASIKRERPQPSVPRSPRINPLRAPKAPAVAAPAFEVARLRRPTAPRSAARAKINVMALAAVAAPTESVAESFVSPVRAQRRETRTLTRVASISPAKLALPDLAAKPTAKLTKRASIERISPVASPERAATRATDTRERDRVAGVSLASLAGCVSDREEDRLKRRVIAAAVGNAQCDSVAGRFRFVETKNLNAFLMWTERAASRRQADRCVELELAIDCLRKGNVTEAKY